MHKGFKFMSRSALAAACLLLAVPAQTAMPAPANVDVDRAHTLILDMDSGRDLTPDIWNPYLPGSQLSQGYHQAVLEPLFMLNYETGQITGWTAESMTPNDTQDVWTLKLRKGVTWSDGVPFTADDVVFTIQMLVSNAPNLQYSADLKQWVANVSKTDDQTVVFNLSKPNPRFQLDYFSVRIWGSVNIAPKHIWDGKDPLTFTNYDPAKGWPVGTGAYKLASISPTEFTYLRDDNWWGAKTGFAHLPEPMKLIWTWAGPEETRAALMADGQLDSLMDITLGTFKAIQARNPNVIAWYPQLPYAWLDPCARNLEFNTAVVDAADAAGLYTKNPLMTHDPDMAKQLIEANGYTMGSDGFYQKDGQQLGMTITTSDTATEHQRIIAVEVEQLQAVGINAVQKNEAEAVWQDNRNFGRFETRQAWDNCGSVNEPWNSLDTLNQKWVVPIGTRASRNPWRWSNAEYSALVDQMGTLPLGDPRIQDMFVKAADIYLSELPTIPITQAKKLIPFDTTHWTGWPTHDNNYVQATTWWQMTPLILQQLH